MVQESDTEKAVYLLERAVALDPHNKLAHKNAADLLARKQVPASAFLDACIHLRLCIMTCSEVRYQHLHFEARAAIYERAVADRARLQIDFDRSKIYFENALKLDPSYADAHNNYGNLLLVSP